MRVTKQVLKLTKEDIAWVEPLVKKAKSKSQLGDIVEELGCLTLTRESYSVWKPPRQPFSRRRIKGGTDIYNCWDCLGIRPTFGGFSLGFWQFGMGKFQTINIRKIKDFLKRHNALSLYVSSDVPIALGIYDVEVIFEYWVLKHSLKQGWYWELRKY